MKHYRQIAEETSQGVDSRGKVIVGSEFSGSRNMTSRGYHFQQKKAPGILLGFSFGLQRAFKVFLRVFNTSYQKLAAFRKK